MDVEELLKTLSFESGPPEILAGTPVSETETVYPTEAAEFELSRIEMEPGGRYVGKAPHGPEAWILLEGSVRLETDRPTRSWERGEAFLIPWGIDFSLEAGASGARFFKAAIPALLGEK